MENIFDGVGIFQTGITGIPIGLLCVPSIDAMTLTFKNSDTTFL